MTATKFTTFIAIFCASARVAQAGWALPVSTDGSCGAPDLQYVCQPGYCCSSFGFCGLTDQYCGDGCQVSRGRSARGGETEAAEPCIIWCPHRPTRVFCADSLRKVRHRDPLSVVLKLEHGNFNSDADADEHLDLDADPDADADPDEHFDVH